ncbi:hypothetical protein SUDANB95_04892 [Actinosynnema sp. ALI-1.44]
MEPIAVIGMAGRFPGASDIAGYWRNLRDAVESVRFPSEGELLAAGVSPEALADPSYVKAVAATPDIDMFDAAFFGMAPREAELTDPQIRLFLETAHRAVEDSGYDPERLTDVGVFGSAGVNRYVDLHVRADNGTVRSASGMSVGTLNNSDYVGTLVSYKFGFRGPSLTVQTACSSSLVAVHLAAQALRNGDCDLALAGGADVEFPVGHGHWWAPGSPLSRDGHCRPFDADAGGTVFGSGVGVVVLKLLSDAVKDGDHIRAVIRGIAVNNDGSDKVGFSAPSVSGQSAVVAEAMAVAGVLPHQIDYVEAHSTGTALGDPIEVAALNQAFRGLRDDLLEPGQTALGSVKGGVGHLGHAAGVASLIKVVLSLENELIPATVNFREPNPKLELDGSPFFINDAARPWPRSATRPRLAGVNSLGIGGTNVHAIVEEAPVPARTVWDRRPTVLVWSGKNQPAEHAYRGALADHLAEHGTDVLVDTVATLRHGRTAHPDRAALVVRDLSSAVAQLRDPSAEAVTTGVARSRPIAFLLPGQGAQYPGAALSLHNDERTFRTALDDCFDLFADQGVDLAGQWRAATADDRVEDTRLAQPLLFAIGYAASRTWERWGVRPDVLLGHSIGEFTAAAVAGVVDLADAVRLVIARAEAMSEAPAGGMLSVAARGEEIAELVAAPLAVAAVNGPRQTVVAGPLEPLEELRSTLEEKGIAVRRVRTSHAFHSPLMEGAAARFERAFAGVTLRAPGTPILSAATGLVMTDAEATNPAFWASQLVRPVRFADAVETLLGRGAHILVEVGPGRTLTSAVRTHPLFAATEHVAVATLQDREAEGGELGAAMTALGVLWVNGVEVDWHEVDGRAPVRRTSVPGYQYQRSRHWVDVPAPESHVPVAPQPVATGTDELAQDPHASDEAAAGPVSYLAWVDNPAPRASTAHREVPTLALLPADPEKALELVTALQQANCRVVGLRPGTSYEETPAGFTVRPHSIADVERAMAAVVARGHVPERFVHAWTAGAWRKPVSVAVRQQLELAFHSLHALVRSSAKLPAKGRIPDVLVLTDRSVDVSGGDPVDPVKAALHGAIRTLAIEEPRAVWKLVDVGPGVAEDDLVRELADWRSSAVVALRGDRRWTAAERPLPVDLGDGSAIRRNGVYVITGGLGGLGLKTAVGLARTGLRPRLVLLSRNGLPEPDERRRLVEAGDARAAAVEEDLARLDALGAQWRAMSCDVTDVRALRRALDVATARFGPVHGVLHLAGVAGGGMLHFREREDAAAVLAPKVLATANLIEAFADRPQLDFFVMLSSRAAVQGLRGGGDYAAANAVLDAFALTEDLPGCRVLSIGSPAWNTVGMAVPGLKAAAASAEAAAVTRWETGLTPGTCPALDEHRVHGKPVLPGTAHLDFVLRAFRCEVLAGEAGPVRLDDVVFERPLVVVGACTLLVEFAAEANGWRFAVRSRAHDGDDEVTHVTGTIGRVTVEPRAVDLDELQVRFDDPEPPPARPNRRLFALGPRWRNVVEVRRTADRSSEKLVSLRLPEAFAGEIGDHVTHPTLLDSATSYVRDAQLDSFHVPFRYRSMIVHRDLPAGFFSHIRRQDGKPGSIVADIDLLAEDGQVLAEITGFTMRQVDADAFDSPPRAGRGPRPERTPEPAAPLEQTGIDPDAGVPMVLRLIAAKTPRHVLLRPVRDGVPIPLEATEQLSPAVVPPAPLPATPVASTAAAGVPVSPNDPPSLEPAAVRPEPAAALTPTAGTTVEDRLRALWTEALGLTEIAVTDDFFEVGGNSLVAVDLMTRIRAAFALDLSIAALFDFPTLGQLAGELRRLGAI